MTKKKKRLLVVVVLAVVLVAQKTSFCNRTNGLIKKKRPAVQ